MTLPTSGLLRAWRRLWRHSVLDCTQPQKLAVTGLFTGTHVPPQRPQQEATTAACVRHRRPCKSNAARFMHASQTLFKLSRVRVMSLRHRHHTHTHRPQRQPTVSVLGRAATRLLTVTSGVEELFHSPAQLAACTDSSRSLSPAPCRKPVLRVLTKGNAVQHGANMADQARPVARVSVRCDAKRQHLQQRSTNNASVWGAASGDGRGAAL